MDLTPQRSLSLIKNIRKDIDKFFERWGIFLSHDKLFFPKVDLKEEKDKFILQAEIPGINPKDIQVFLKNDNILVIQGKTEEENRSEKEGFLSVERFSGNFYREFTLSSNIKAEEIQAKSKRGILEIIAPKTENKKFEKLIEIKSEE